jgi:WD40 repeat protein
LAAIGAVVVLAACSSETGGTPSTASYTPLTLSSMTARTIPLPSGTLAVAPDGSVALVQTDDGWCLRDRDAGPGGVTASTSAAASSESATSGADPAPSDRCLDLPDNARIGSAAFSPDGRHIAMAEDYIVTFQGRLWVADSTDGTVREVAPTARAGAMSSDPSLAPTTTTSTTAGTRRFGNGSQYFLPTWDRETGALVVLEFATVGSTEDAVVLVDPAAGRASVLATLPTRSSGQLAAGGGTVVAGTSEKGSPPFDLQVIDEKGGAVRTAAGPASMATDAFSGPAAVAPDGSRVVVLGVDQRRSAPASPVVVDLSDGSSEPLPGLDEQFSWSASYSPDGSLLAVLTTGTASQDVQVQVIDGANVRPLARSDRFNTVRISLEWSRSDVLAPRSGRGALQGQAVAWQLGG